MPFSDNDIKGFLQGRNSMTVQATILPPTNVPGGGYWLNDVEVDLDQLIQAYREYVEQKGKRVLMGNK